MRLQSASRGWTKTRIVASALVSFLVASALLQVSPLVFSAGGGVACGDILTASATLSADLQCSGPGLILGGGITLDCALHSITGSGYGVGVNVTDVSGVTIKNCAISNFEIGLLISSSNRSVFSSDSVSNSSNAGFIVAWSRSDVFTGDVATDNRGGGFWLQFSDNATMINDTATHNADQGFVFEASSFTRLTNSFSAFNSDDGFFVTTPFAPVVHDVLENDTSNHNGNVGFDLQGSFYSHIVNDSAGSNQFSGFEIYGGAHNVVSGNTALNNSLYGGYAIWQTSSNIIDSNNATGNGYTGFDISQASNNTLVGNIALTSRYDGFRIEASAQNNTIRANSANSNIRYGILDNSTGAGVFGTSTTYAINECEGNGLGNSNPSGLCSTPVAGGITPANATIDGGQSVTLNASASGGTPPYSYHWYTGDQCSIPVDGNGSAFPVAPLSNSSYSYIARDSSPARVSTACSQPSRVIVNPMLSATIEPLQGYVMPWTSVTLNASVSGGTRPYSYQWYAGSTCIGRLNGTSPSYSAGALSGDRTFSVLVTDSSGGTPRAALCETIAVNVFPIYLVLSIIALVLLAAVFVFWRAKRDRPR